MSGKYALIIGNTEYGDPGLAQLTTPGKDAEDFVRVLRDPKVCAFDDVSLLLNQPEHIVRARIDEFFDQKKPDDLLVLYFSGHGVRDELGALYLAVKNTNRFRLRSTAIKSDFIREAMDQSRSKRQVLVLDCCNSGAFAQGMKSATGVSIGTASAFEAGYGRIILTASDSTQFAWEGDKVIGETDNSLFTHFLVEGLQGEADLDGDGQITVDELYDYAYEKVKLATPKQTPSKFSSKQQGEIILRQITRMEDIKPVSLPDELIEEIEDPRPYVREAAVQKLERMLKGRNIGLARSAKDALERIARFDDSRRVSSAAKGALGIVQSPIQPTVDEVMEDVSPPIARKVEPSNLEIQEVATNSSAPVLIALGWTVAGVIGGIIYDSIGPTLGGGLGGAVGGAFTGMVLKQNEPQPNQKRIFLFALAWAIGIAAGWTIGEDRTEASGIALGYAIGAAISMAILIGVRQVTLNWKSIIWTIFSWSIGAALGWLIAKKLIIEQLYLDYVIGWAIGTPIGWAIAGYVLGCHLLNNKKVGKT